MEGRGGLIPPAHQILAEYSRAAHAPLFPGCRISDAALQHSIAPQHLSKWLMSGKMVLSGGCCIAI
jgi:hypothetical protein